MPTLQAIQTGTKRCSDCKQEKPLTQHGFFVVDSLS